MVWEIHLNGKTACMDRDLSKTISSTRSIGQDPSFLLSHLLLILAIIADCGAVCRVVVVQPDPEIVIYCYVVLPRANTLCSSMTQENMRRVQIRPHLNPIEWNLHKFAECHNEAIDSAGYLIIRL